MRENVGGVDRIMRSLASPLLLKLGYRWLRKGHYLRGAVSIVGGALLGETAITRVCPMNRLFGLNTSRRQPA